jgi:hypothetical protein
MTDAIIQKAIDAYQKALGIPSRKPDSKVIKAGAAKIHTDPKLRHFNSVKQLPDSLKEVFNLISRSGHRGISTVELGKKGILNASKKVSALKSRGALIKTSLAPAKNYKSGNKHKRVAHYSHVGWQFNMEDK